MKFALVSTIETQGRGGSEELWRRTAARLSEAGHRVAASISFAPELSPALADLQSKGVTMHGRAPLYPNFAGRLWRKATHAFRWNWLARFAPDLVVISQGGPWENMECADFCRTAGLPYVLIEQANGEGWWPADEMIPRLQEIFCGAKKVFCVSQHNLRLLGRQLQGPLSNGEVVWNPVNLSQTDVVPWPDETGEYHLACVGRLDLTSKGQDVLFEVLALPRWRARPLRMNLYGTGSNAKTLQALAASLGLESVRFHGQLADLRAIWAANHLLVLPSRVEGLPLALVEAMWCGRPAVVTDAGGNAEMCLDGVTGFIAPAATVELLEAALERAWEQRETWEKMGRAARARVEQRVPRDPIEQFQEKLLQLV